jgi:hypothetical protein
VVKVDGEGMGAMKPGVGGDPVEVEEVELECWWWCGKE